MFIFIVGGGESFLNFEKPVASYHLTLLYFGMRKNKPKGKNTHNDILKNLHFFYPKFHKGNLFFNIKVFKVLKFIL